MEITISTVIQIAVVVAGIGILKNDVAAVKQMINDIKTTLYGADGRNGIVGDMVIVKEHTKRCPAREDKNGQ